MFRSLSCMLIALTSSLASASELTPAELRIWNDPAFQREFAQSYIAETDIEPRVNAEERETMLEVLDLIAAEKLDEAIALLDKNRNEAVSAVFDFTIGNIYFQREQLQPAAAAYEIAVQKHPKFRRAWRNLGLIYVRRSEWQSALDALTEVIQLGGGDALTYGLTGYAYSNIGNSISAESAYRMAILLDPETADWKMGLAQSLFRQQRYADAVALCDQMIESSPESANLWMLQANAYIGLKQPLRAAQNYELVDRLGKSTVDSLNMLGDIYINEQLFQLAVDTYSRAMDMNPQNDPNRAISAAQVITSHGVYEEATRLLDRVEVDHAGRLSEDDKKAILKIRARLAVAQGAGGEHVRVLQEIVRIDPIDGEALILLGKHYRRAGELEKAIFHFETAAGIERFEADAKVRHAQILVEQGDYVGALPLLRQAQLVRPVDYVQSFLDQVERRASQGR